MGLFKKVKKAVKSIADSPIGKLAVTGVAGATGGLVGGLAASTLLSGMGKDKSPNPEAVPASPIAALPPVTADAALRAQEGGQYAEGGAVLGTGVDLLGDTSIDEVKRRRASRTLLG